MAYLKSLTGYFIVPSHLSVTDNRPRKTVRKDLIISLREKGMKSMVWDRTYKGINLKHSPNFTCLAINVFPLIDCFE